MEDHAPVSDSNDYEEPIPCTSTDCTSVLRNCSAIVSVVDGRLHTTYIPSEPLISRKYDDMSTLFNNTNNNDATIRHYRHSSLFDFATIGMRTASSTTNRPSVNNSPCSPLLIGGGSSSSGGASYACGSLVPLRGPPPIHAPPQPPNCPPPKRRPQHNTHRHRRHKKCINCCLRVGRWPAILFLLVPAMLLLLSLCLLLVWLTLLRENSSFTSFSSQKFVNDQYSSSNKISFLSNAQQQQYSAHQLPVLPTHLPFNQPFIIQLPPYHLLFTQFYISQNSLFQLNLTIGSSSRIIIFAKQTIRPTIGLYDWQKIISGENLHLEKEINLIINNDENKKVEKKKKRLGLIRKFLQAGIWHLGFLNDKIETEYIELIAQLEEPLPIEQKNNQIISQCHSDCFGKGECREGRCVCHPGYGGLFCEETSCPVLCSGQGVFNKGRCLCHQGFRGVECEETIEWCNNKNCGIGGQCQEENGICKCLPGWSGISCENNINEIQKNEEKENIKKEEAKCSLNCSNNGNCIFITQNENNGEIIRNFEHCKCLSGWTGINCQLELCPKNCSSNGQCMLGARREGVGGEDWWHCECNFGYFGEYCQFRAESDCEDGKDNDEDGLTDCEDSTECCSHNSCSSNSLCLGSHVSPELLLKLATNNNSEQKENNTTLQQTPFFDRVRFLFDGGDLSVQRYTDTKLLDPKLLSVLRGRILSIRGGPLAGVRVSVADHPQQGFSLSRSFSHPPEASESQNYIDTSIGEFELAVNGGAEVILQFVRQPFGRILRTFFVPSNQIVDVGNVWMDSLEISSNEKEASSIN